MPEATIGAGFARALLNFAHSKGADRSVLVQRAHLESTDLIDPDSRVPFASYMLLMKAAIELCNEPALALQFGESVRLKDISIAGHVGHRETAEKARDQANRFGRLAVDDPVDTSQCVELVTEESNVWLTFPGAIYKNNPLFA